MEKAREETLTDRKQVSFCMTHLADEALRLTEHTMENVKVVKKYKRI